MTNNISCIYYYFFQRVNIFLLPFFMSLLLTTIINIILLSITIYIGTHVYIPLSKKVFIYRYIHIKSFVTLSHIMIWTYTYIYMKIFVIKNILPWLYVCIYNVREFYIFGIFLGGNSLAICQFVFKPKTDLNWLNK